MDNYLEAFDIKRRGPYKVRISVADIWCGCENCTARIRRVTFFLAF